MNLVVGISPLNTDTSILDIWIRNSNLLEEFARRIIGSISMMITSHHL